MLKGNEPAELRRVTGCCVQVGQHDSRERRAVGHAWEPKVGPRNYRTHLKIFNESYIYLGYIRAIIAVDIYRNKIGRVGLSVQLLIADARIRREFSIETRCRERFFHRRLYTGGL
jgi:hypothetical protein